MANQNHNKPQAEADLQILVHRARQYAKDWKMDLDAKSEGTDFVLAVMSCFAQRLARTRKPEITREPDPEYPDVVPDSMPKALPCINHASLEKELGDIRAILMQVKRVTENTMTVQEDHVRATNVAQYSDAYEQKEVEKVKEGFLDANLEYARMEGERDTLKGIVDRLLEAVIRK